jgi:hypothetical protein
MTLQAAAKSTLQGEHQVGLPMRPDGFFKATRVIQRS